MKKIILFYLILFICSLNSLYSQTTTPTWGKYVGALTFPPSDSSHCTPYLCTVDGRGRLWVATSKVTNANSHNAIYYADSTDLVLHKFVDFDENGDSDTLTGNIGQIRGITALNNDIYINATMPFKKFNATVSCVYIYPNADTTLVQKWGFNISGSSGYGTHNHGGVITKDTIFIAGVTAGATGPGPFVRGYNFKYGQFPSGTTPARGSWISESQLEPGGNHSAGFDIIRDMAIVPNGDYSDPNTPIYSSRNSTTTSTTGGIAVWTGGNQFAFGNYSGTRVQDIRSELVLGSAIPCGITVDKNGLLWVARVDSGKQWVRGYQVLLNSATPKFELPSKYSSTKPDSTGAPMRNPTDVAFTPDGMTAYVTDANKVVYKFKLNATSTEDDKVLLNEFKLNQNYPNPFNPVTTISYSLPKSSNVKLIVSNALGEIVATLFDGNESAGNHSKVFYSGNLTSGIYFYTITTDFGIATRKMLILK